MPGYSKIHLLNIGAKPITEHVDTDSDTLIYKGNWYKRMFNYKHDGDWYCAYYGKIIPELKPTCNKDKGVYTDVEWYEHRIIIENLKL